MTTSLIQDNTVPNLTLFKAISVATTNATSVTNVLTRLHSLCLQGTTATARYVKLYNKATTPVVGTDIPVLTFMVPANGQMVNPEFGFGVKFPLGLAFAITAGVADADTAVVAANDVIVNMGYRTPDTW